LEDNKIETETRSLTLPKETWATIDSIAKKYVVINAQEIIRRCIDSMIKGEEKQ
jgi:hypothetical protein